MNGKSPERHHARTGISIFSGVFRRSGHVAENTGASKRPIESADGRSRDERHEPEANRPGARERRAMITNSEASNAREQESDSECDSEPESNRAREVETVPPSKRARDAGRDNDHDSDGDSDDEPESKRTREASSDSDSDDDDELEGERAGDQEAEEDSDASSDGEGEIGGLHGASLENESHTSTSTSISTRQASSRRQSSDTREPHLILVVGDSTFEYSQGLREGLNAKESELGERTRRTEITASGLQSKSEVKALLRKQKIPDELKDASGYHIQHEVDATQLQEKFNPNSFDRIIWNNPEATGTDKTDITGAVINALLESAPKVLRPHGEVNIGITASPKAKGAAVLMAYSKSKSVTVGAHRYLVYMLKSEVYMYRVVYPSRQTTGGQIRGTMGPKLYFIFKLQNA